jgi:hypothetical protein
MNGSRSTSPLSLANLERFLKLRVAPLAGCREVKRIVYLCLGKVFLSVLQIKTYFVIFFFIAFNIFSSTQKDCFVFVPYYLPSEAFDHVIRIRSGEGQWTDLPPTDVSNLTSLPVKQESVHNNVFNRLKIKC